MFTKLKLVFWTKMTWIFSYAFFIQASTKENPERNDFQWWLQNIWHWQCLLHSSNPNLITFLGCLIGFQSWSWEGWLQTINELYCTNYYACTIVNPIHARINSSILRHILAFEMPRKRILWFHFMGVLHESYKSKLIQTLSIHKFDSTNYVA